MIPPEAVGEPAQKSWYKEHPRSFWVIVTLVVLLDILYDYYSPRAIIIDVFIAAALLIRYYKKKPH
jgi:hypothetical protein